MFENVIKFEAKVEDKVSHWFLANGTPMEIAEKMAFQFLQHLASIKAAQIAEQAKQSVPAQEPPVSPVAEPKHSD